MPTDMCVEGEKGGEGREEEKRDRDSWQAIICLRMGMCMLTTFLMMKLEQVPTGAADPIHTAKARTIIVSHSTLSLVSPHCVTSTIGCIIRRVQCQGQACRLHGECYKSQCRRECFLVNVFMRNLSHGVHKVCRLLNLQTFCCTRGRQNVTDLLAGRTRDVHLHRARNKLLVLQRLEFV